MRGVHTPADTKWWECGNCGGQIAVSAVVYTQLDCADGIAPARAARFGDTVGEVMLTALVIGSDGLADTPHYCPICGTNARGE